MNPLEIMQPLYDSISRMWNFLFTWHIFGEARMLQLIFAMAYLARVYVFINHFNKGEDE